MEGIVMRMAILDDYSASSLDYSFPSCRITRINTSIIIHQQDLIAALLPFEIISCMRERTKFPSWLLSQLPRLRFITTTGMRNNGIDQAACHLANIIVSGTEQHGPATGTVETTFALILALARRIVVEDRAIRLGQFQTGIATGLNGKTIGLIGLGRLGSQVAMIAQAFGMNVIAWSPHMTPDRAARVGVQAVSLDHLLSTADVISLHLILADSTRDILGARELSLVKKTAFIVNTSRGQLINEDAMLALLREGRIGGIGLDVYNIEPLPIDHELRSLGNVVLSPHLGYVDDDTYNSWWPQTVENVAAFIGGKPIRLLQPLKAGVF